MSHSEIALIFPHQLFRNHPAVSKGRPAVLVEDSLYFGDRRATPGSFHRQKIALHRGSMLAYEKQLTEETGHKAQRVLYDPEKTLRDVLSALHAELTFALIHVVEPHDFLLKKRLEKTAEKLGVELKMYPSPMFLTPMDWAADHFDNRKRPFMASFYEGQRKRMGILIDKDEKPTGGKWSYDDENRKPMPKRGGLDVPELKNFGPSKLRKEAQAYAQSDLFAKAYGSVDEFWYPLTHDEADAWLEHFFEWRFDRFGPYEDSIAAHEAYLFHSLLTPMLNIGLLTPGEVIDRAIEYAEAADVPLNSLEGFVRQIIGWREFMLQMYERHGVEMRNSNFFDHSGSIPKAFWDGTTGVGPIDTVIRRVVKTGYAHHIERLMVLGNFMLLCGFHPREVNDWFHALFIDAYDWVMVPNVFGMSQFADGGIFTTKPYISGSNYICKMSDYKKGDWCETWDGLFWSFIDQHYEYFKSQHRLAMMARNLEKMDRAKKESHHRAAQEFLGGLV